MQNEILNISGVSCYEKDGMAYLDLEAVARGLGFTQTKNGTEYVRWETIEKLLAGLISFPNKLGKDGIACGPGQLPEFIPENIFYRLAMKAKNETAEKFQAKVADEIIPSIRKHGAYMTQETLQAALLSPDTMIALCQQLKDEQCKRQKLEAAHSELQVQAEIMRPKADYFDQLVDRNLLTSLRDTSKVLGVGQTEFIGFLTKRGFLFRDKKGKLMPTASKNDGLFEVKECFNEKTAWSGVQTMVTPKGRETFRMLMMG